MQHWACGISRLGSGVLSRAVGLLVLYNQATQADSSLGQSLSGLSSIVKVNSTLALGTGFWAMIGGLGAILIGGLLALLFSRNA